MSRSHEGRDGAADIDTLLVHEIRHTWWHENRNRFRGALRAPAFALHDGEGSLGTWQPEARTISLARRFVREAPWGQVVEVLLHEMAHQYVTEVLRRPEEPPHGPAFRWTCRNFGVDPSAAGALRDAGAGEAEPKVVRRVRGLLALSSSPNEHEARAALAAARRLLLEHNLSEAEVGGGTAADDFGVRHLGPIHLRIPLYDKVLAGILTEHFFVDVVWVPALDRERHRHGKQLEVLGTRANLDVAEWVHATVRETALRLWERARREGGLPGRERRAFLVGVMRGFRDRLDQQARASAEEGLVWVGDPRLERWVASRYPRLRTMAAARGVRIGEGYAAGREAGRNIELRRPLRGGSAGGPRGLIEG